MSKARLHIERRMVTLDLQRLDNNGEAARGFDGKLQRKDA